MHGIVDRWSLGTTQGLKSEFRFEIRTLIGLQTDQGLAVSLDRSADRSRQIQYATVSSWIGQPTDPEANRDMGGELIGLPTDQGAPGSVGRPIQLRPTQQPHEGSLIGQSDRSVRSWIGRQTDPGAYRSERRRESFWIGPPTDPETPTVPVSSWIDPVIDPTAQSICGSIEMPDYS